jgi:hypothetical protein
MSGRLKNKEGIGNNGHRYTGLAMLQSKIVVPAFTVFKIVRAMVAVGYKKGYKNE